MRILRVTHFRWGDTINNWYDDEEAVQRQLATEKQPGPDIVHTDWYRCERIEILMPVRGKEVQS